MNVRHPVLLVLAALALAACPANNTPQPSPPSPPPGTGYEPPPTPHGAPAGAACAAPTDCASGVCEGEGCGATLGVCAEASRACTKDLREYCGCDGVTFGASGSCPGRRFAYAGECKAAEPEPPACPGAPDCPKQADGSPCLAGTDCISGTCEGEGCGADTPGVCVAERRRCTRDRRPYCGCDGNTFYGSGTCPGRRYSAREMCPGGK